MPVLNGRPDSTITLLETNNHIIEYPTTSTTIRRHGKRTDFISRDEAVQHRQ